MEFGTYFAYWEQEWRGDYFAYCRKVKNLGFDILEISAAGLLEMDIAEIDRMRKEAENLSLGLTAGIGFPADHDPSSADSETRRRGMDLMRRMVLRLEKAGITKVGGVIFASWPYDYQKPFDKPAVWARSVESMRKAADLAKDHGVVLMMEVVNRFEHFLVNSAEECVRFVKDIGKPNVKVMLDTFHMNIEEDHLGDAIRTAGPLLGHLHLGECNRKVPGQGHMPWDDIAKGLRDINYQAAAVMEPFVRMGGTVGQEIKVWRDLSKGADTERLDADIKEALRFVRGKFNH
ncbi:MAG: sugar phosphate isomerase/epimerase [Planctomycetota bacterium]|jgi:D-psicose/D-tagatose/L-ribulose 3-epimerase|nr:sugar phosphate isomerase/epimerase [Planctomycetota bacterium]